MFPASHVPHAPCQSVSGGVADAAWEEEGGLGRESITHSLNTVVYKIDIITNVNYLSYILKL